MCHNAQLMFVFLSTGEFHHVPRLALNSWAKVIFLSQPPKVLGLQAWSSAPLDYFYSSPPESISEPFWGMEVPTALKWRTLCWLTFLLADCRALGLSVTLDGSQVVVTTGLELHSALLASGLTQCSPNGGAQSGLASLILQLQVAQHREGIFICLGKK